MEQLENKQFGKYDGGILKDPSCVTTCTEQELYFYIKTFNNMFWKLRHDIANGKTTENIDLTSYQYVIEYCVMHTTRFGVELDEPKEGKHIDVSMSYFDWFNWWDTYFQKTLSKEEYNNYKHKKDNGDDISQFRPNGDWRNV